MTMTAEKTEEMSFVLNLKASFKEYQNYSKSEQKLFDLMPKDGVKISSIDLTEKRRKKWKWNIEHGRNAVSVTMGSLMRKIDNNREPFILLKSEQKGPYPLEFWLEWLPVSQRSLRSRMLRRERQGR